MAEGRSRVAWRHTSAVLVFLAEPNRDRKKYPRPFTAGNFDPHSREFMRLGNVSRQRVSVDQLAGEIVGEAERRYGRRK